MSNNVNNELCTSCNKRELCAVLCPEAELFVSQDQADWGATPVLYRSQDGEHIPVFDPRMVREATVTLSPLETKVAVAINAGYTREQVAEITGISRGHLRKIIHSCKMKYENRA